MSDQNRTYCPYCDKWDGEHDNDCESIKFLKSLPKFSEIQDKLYNKKMKEPKESS